MNRITAAALCSLWATSSLAQSTLAPVPLKNMCVTDGTAMPNQDGTIRIDTPSIRAVANGTDGRLAEIRFRYLGPPADAKPLASGEVRRQIALKLRAMDTCNVVYAAWHIEPDTKIVVSIKRNSAWHTNNECHASGYTTIRPTTTTPAMPIKPGETHIFRAVLQGTTLVLTADGTTVWSGTLPDTINTLDGPSGFRTDNARFDLQFLAGTAAPNPAFHCTRGLGD